MSRSAKVAPGGYLASLVVVVLGLLLAVGIGRPAGAVDRLPDIDDVRPSMVVLVEVEIDEASARQELPNLLDVVSRQPGVAKVAGEGRDNGFVLYVSNESGSGTVGQRWATLSRSIEDHLEPAESRVTLGGRQPFLDAVASGYRLSVAALVLLGLAAAGYTYWRFGTRAGLAGVATAIFAIPLSAALPARILGPFDGTVTTTILPGALAGLVIVVTSMTRFARWFEQGSGRSEPEAGSGADAIAESIGDCGPALGLATAVVGVAAIITEFMGAGHSGLMAVLLGAGTASVLCLAMIPFILVDDGGARTPPTEAMVRVGPDPLRASIAAIDGRNFSLGLLGLFAGVLVALGVFAFREPSGGRISPSDLGDRSSVAAADRFLDDQNADPTEAIVYIVDSSVGDAEAAGWAESVSNLSGVAWVDGVGQRWIDGTVLEPAAGESLVVDPTGDVALDARLYLIVPVRPGGAGQDALVEAVSAADPQVAGELLQTSVGPDSGTQSDLSSIVVALVLLALAAAAALYWTTGGLGVAFVAGMIQLLEGSAVVGTFSLLVPHLTLAEILVGLGVVSLAGVLVSVELVEELMSRPRMRWRLQAHAVDSSLGLVALASAGVALVITSIFGGGPLTSRFGVCLAVASSVVLIVGVLVLRPALLVQRSQFAILARPFRVYALSGRADTVDLPDPDDSGHDGAWWSVATGLVETEYLTQSRPGDLPLDQLFIPDTPIFQTAAERLEAMSAAGLKVVGSPPRLLAVDPLTDHFVTKLRLVTDHPRRDLIDRRGRVVGRRRGERKEGVLWIVEGPDGRWRVQESIEEAAQPLSDEASTEVIDLTDSAQSTGPVVSLAD